MLPQKYSAELFIQDQNKELLIMLIRQLNKDFSLTGIDFAFEEKLQIKELVNQLNENIEYLIKNDFQSYLNLLYRIDISESKMKEMNEIEKFIISLGDFGLTSNYRNLESLKTRISLEIGKACDTLYESYQEAVSAEDAEKAGKILEKLLETAPDESKYHAWAAKQLKQMK